MDNRSWIIKDQVPERIESQVADVSNLVQAFLEYCEPLETDDTIFIFTDARTGARFCECHILVEKLIKLGTIDAALDPEEQQEYRANRDIVTSHAAFEDMKEDALQRRTFSNLVLEFTTDYDSDHPLKVVGGQHRFEAIRLASEAGINEHHGVKVYLA